MQSASRQTNWILIALGLVLLGAAGCAGVQNAPPITHFYTLAYAPPRIAKRPVLPITLRVEEFQIEPAYDTTKMVYSGSPLRIQYYNYHKWYAHPGILTASFLQRDLRESHLFKGVFNAHHPFDVSHLVTGSVDAFYELDAPDKWQARLSLTVALLKTDDSDPAGQVLFQKNYRADIKSADKTPAAVAAAMSEAMQIVSGNLMQDLYTALSSIKE